MNGSVRIPAVRAVVLHEGRFLLAQHHNYLPGTIGKWGLPGGRIEATDADLVAALRRHGLVRFLEQFIEQFPTSHLKDLVVDEISEKRLIAIEGRRVVRSDGEPIDAILT